VLFSFCFVLSEKETYKKTSSLMGRVERIRGESALSVKWVEINKQFQKAREGMLETFNVCA
jgi:hypothetical protein